mmetsp:Transcript_2663/g.6779  ORF Transcript_2663/g.6779 Transcript_2663/m.6779 type:complete len:244 (+) Transcript_2663:309-1040(+)
MSATLIGLSTDTNVMPRMLLAGSDTARVYLPGGKSKGMPPVAEALLTSPCSLVKRSTVLPLWLSIPMQFLSRTLTRGTTPTVSHVTERRSPATALWSWTGWTHRRGWMVSISNLVSSGDTVTALGSVASSMPTLLASCSIMTALASVTRRVARARRSLRADVMWTSSSAMWRPTSSMAMPVMAPAADESAWRELSAAPLTPSFSMRSTRRLRRSCASLASPQRDLAHVLSSSGRMRRKHSWAK